MATERYRYREHVRRLGERRGRSVRARLGALAAQLWGVAGPTLASLLLVGIVFAVLWRYSAAHGEGLAFRYPQALLLLLALPLVLAMEIFMRRRLSARLAFTRVDLLARLPGRTWTSFLVHFPGVMRGAAAGLLVLAIARPQATAVREQAEVEGIDIILTLDMSGSMKAADIRPSRLEGAKAVIDDFITRRVNDKIGVVIFGREAMTLCPLTLDYNVVRGLVRGLELGAIDGRGTAIGNALGVAINRLRKSTAETKVIVLLTDGANNQGNVAPQQASDFGRALGIKVYTILAGKQDETPVEVDTDHFGLGIFQTARFPVNPELLRGISEKTGGKFYTAQDRAALESSFHSILDALEKTRMSDVGVVYAETFQRFLVPAIVILLIELLFALTIGRKSP